ncbi:MAG TPA: PadR family transcriptional regulator [Acidimicrobiales bacterium]|nr:PadR family transcriptional regulator [Acidimicrobiales bacterium]
MTALREPTFLILVALASGPLHGYGIIKEVAALSDGRVRLRAGTLYGALERLEAEAHISFEGEEAGEGPTRRRYRLTRAGRALLDAEVRRMEANLGAARSKLRPAEA